MVIEFIGTTGVGKTTLIRKLCSRLAESEPAIEAVRLAVGFLGLRSGMNATVENVVQEIIGFPFFVLAAHKYRNFLGYTMRLFALKGHSGLERINNLRSLERKVGINEIVRLYGGNRHVLVDEGPLLVAHMFAFGGGALTRDEIENFARLVPLPDLIVYVKAPVDVVVGRTIGRADAPRQLRARDCRWTERTIENATRIFDELVKAENIRCRLLTVESTDAAESAYKKTLDDVSRQILDRRMAVHCRGQNVESIA